MRRRFSFETNILSTLSKFAKDFFGSSPYLGIDLGSSQIRISMEGKGVIYKEKTYVVQNSKNNELIAFGNEAYEMLGKTPPNLKVFCPIERGRVSDFDGVVYLLKRSIERAISPYFRNAGMLRFNALFGVPLGLTEVEEMAILDVGKKVGANKVSIVETPIAAGFGLKAPIMENTGTFLVDIGGGTTELSLLSLGGVVLFKVLKIGGVDFNEALINYLRIRYGILVGEKTAEELKLNLGPLIKKSDLVLEISGRSVESGMPKTVNIKSSLLYEPLYPYFGQIIEAIREAIEETPPELIKDIQQNGIVFIGMSTLFPELLKYIKEELKVEMKTREEPEYCVVRGLNWLIEHPEILKKVCIKFE